MGEKVKLENKYIAIGDNDYRLSIAKSCEGNYKAYLSDVHSQYTAERHFGKNMLNKHDLKEWIVECDHLNNPETRFFKQLEEWDGVIEV